MVTEVPQYSANHLMLTPLLKPADEAQEPKIPRVGYLTVPSASAQASRVEAFRKGLRQLGYIEGQNIIVEYRFAEGNLDRVPVLAAELVNLKVDVIVSAGMAPTRSAKKATGTIPIVMAKMTIRSATNSSPVLSDLAETLLDSPLLPRR
jgi:ABC-type uncharacterized transport system substrate-binding protein